MYLKFKKFKRKLGEYDHYYYYSLEKLSNYFYEKYNKSRNGYTVTEDFKPIMMQRLSYSITFLYFLHQLLEEQLKGVFTLSQLAYMALAFDHRYINEDFPCMDLKEDLYMYLDGTSVESLVQEGDKYLSISHILTCDEDLGDICEFKRVIDSVSMIDLAVLFDVIIELRRNPDDSENISLMALFNRLKK